MSLFTPEELEELRRADAEIEESFRITNEELRESRKRDKAALLDRKDSRGKKIAAQQAAYYEANREKYNAYMREYMLAHRKKKAASGVEDRKAAREKEPRTL